MKKSFKELLDADILVAVMYKKYPDLKESKFGYAWKRFYEKNIDPLAKEYRESLQNIRIDNALEDKETGKIITEEASNANMRGFAYSKEGLKAVIKAEKDLENKFFAKEVKVEPFIATSIPTNVKLTQEEIEVLTGLVI